MPAYFYTIIVMVILGVLFIGLNTVAGGFRILKRDHPDNEAYIRIYKGVENIAILTAVLFFFCIISLAVALAVGGI